jgi:predicted CDP-diglyceride synthetase/phosphatidate cytidylyltransferase
MSFDDFFRQALDYLANSGVLFSLVISFITLGIYAHLIYIQSKETVSIRDFLNKYRVYILTFLVVSFLTLIPVTYFLFMRSIGVNDEDLRNFATISGRIGPLAQAIAFEVIFFYRNKRGE